MERFGVDFRSCCGRNSAVRFDLNLRHEESNGTISTSKVQELFLSVDSSELLLRSYVSQRECSFTSPVPTL